jgi:hypothetical protein
MALKHTEIKTQLKSYFDSLDIGSQSEYRLFDHADDGGEKSFTIDFVTHPYAEKGERESATILRDISRFQSFRDQIDQSIDQLRE